MVELRRGLLRLHKALIDSERVVFERTAGPQSNVQLLQALLEDPFFAWLRPFSPLSAGEPVAPEAARGYVGSAHALLALPADAGAEAQAHHAQLEAVRQRDPAVQFAITEMQRRVAAASLALDDAP
jgi:hypothetical protein